jgi:hypothetical protein
MNARSAPTRAAPGSAIPPAESTCCPHLKFRYEQTDGLNVLHVSADDDPEGAIDRIHRLLQQK